MIKIQNIIRSKVSFVNSCPLSFGEIWRKLYINKERKLCMVMTDYDRQYHAALDSRRKRIMVTFVEATRELIQSEGVDGLSIRKIANEAGYNSATMYNYFRDLEHLTLFGSVCYLREYVMALASSLKPDMNALERFRTIYHCFNSFAFRHPDIFHKEFLYSLISQQR